MESLYGGQRGKSFVLRKVFKTVKEMTTEFKKGVQYTDVHFGEYVIINTDDKRNIENGQLYRRDADYNNSTGGATYVGTIVGPMGPVTDIALAAYNANDPDKGEWTVPSNTMVSGKTQTDRILWSKKYEDIPGGNRLTTIGLKIPYPEFEFEVKAINNQLPMTVTRLATSQPFYNKYHMEIPFEKPSVAFFEQGHSLSGNNDFTQLPIGGAGFEYYNKVSG